MKLTQVQISLAAVSLITMVSIIIGQQVDLNATFPTHPLFEFPPLNRSTMLRAKAMLRWMIDNRTENGTRTFNAGFIRLIFHDCVGGCDGCVNLRNPGNTGLGFYKLPLDLMYQDFIFPWMSRADWYALAGVTAVEYAAELTPCEGKNCRQDLPDIEFRYGRRDCVSEPNIFRFIPGPALDPRFTIRNTFRLNFAEITALMGAHCLGKNHQRDQRWVDDGTKFNNQYYKDMLSLSREWKRGNGTTLNEWTSQTTGNVMLSSDMFMAWDVSNATACNDQPKENCNPTNTLLLVEAFANDNEFWMREFSVAFNVMLMNGNFGRLKSPLIDTMDTEWRGNPDELFPEKNPESDYEFDPIAAGIDPVLAGLAPPPNTTASANSTASTAADTATESSASTSAETTATTTTTTTAATASASTSTETVPSVETAETEKPADTADSKEDKAADTEDTADREDTAADTEDTAADREDTAAGSSAAGVLGISVEPSDSRINNDVGFRAQVLGLSRQRTATSNSS